MAKNSERTLKGESGPKELPPYKPMHGSSTDGDSAKAGANDYAGYGPTDGVQSMGSEKEADEMLAYDMNKRTAEYNVRSPGMKARYTKEFNQD